MFNEPVTGFGDSSDVTLGGTAGATTAAVTELAPNNRTTYAVAVSGMTTDGTVIASVPANAATDAAGNGSTAATSTDNTVTFIANRPPVAVADSYNTNEDTTLNVPAPGVLGNDTDPDPGDTLTAVFVSGPSHGSVTLNANGAFSYVPAPNYNGPDSFSYKARDAKGAESASRDRQHHRQRRQRSAHGHRRRGRRVRQPAGPAAPSISPSATSIHPSAA